MEADGRKYLNEAFLSGLGCGICLGLSFYIYKRFNFRAKAAAIKKVLKAIQHPIKLLREHTLCFLSHNTLISQLMTNQEYKVVLVVRNDLQMSKGKIASQCGHAAVGVYEAAMKSDPEALELWQTMGQPKVALKVDSLEDIIKLDQAAKKLGLITSPIKDAGRTQVAPSTVTVLGIGPGPKNVVDQVTGHLKLL